MINVINKKSRCYHWPQKSRIGWAHHDVYNIHTYHTALPPADTFSSDYDCGDHNLPYINIQNSHIDSH